MESSYNRHEIKRTALCENKVVLGTDWCRLVNVSKSFIGFQMSEDVKFSLLVINLIKKVWISQNQFILKTWRFWFKTFFDQWNCIYTGSKSHTNILWRVVVIKGDKIINNSCHRSHICYLWQVFSISIAVRYSLKFCIIIVW